MNSDLHATRERILSGQTSAAEQLEHSADRAQSSACEKVFLKTTLDDAAQVARQRDIGRLPLAGLAVSIKDLFDVQGQVTAAGSVVLADAPPALQDCPAVARLKSAGAALIGRTNMTEFAFSAVGTNPHFGTPSNAADPAVPRIPGGSSSGAAVSVASGAAFVGLGSDTGGSIRIPAALNGIVGFKSTARLVPLEGALPLSTTLDSVCAMTRSVRDAILVHEILSGSRVGQKRLSLASYRLAVPDTTMLDDLDPTVAAAFDTALLTLRSAGARIEHIPLDAIRDLGTIQTTGGFTAAESFAWHRRLLAERGDDYDPRVRVRITRGEAMKAWEYIELGRARQDWIARVATGLQGFDAMLSPTVPIVAPPIAQVAPGAERDGEFFRVNGLLLRNTSIVNMLDGCAISLPCHRAGQLPVGLMIWQGALHDETVLNVASEVERALAPASRHP